MRKTVGMTPLNALRWIAPLEATSFLALLVASYIKHQDGGETGVALLGPIHGLLFLAYVALALVVRREAGWSNTTTGWALLGAVLPFGGYVVERQLLRPRPAT